MTSPTDRSVDVETITRLVESLERDLARVRAGQADVESLRDEVEGLRAILDRGSAVEHHDVHGPLGRVRDLLHRASDELAADALPATDYVQRIARMLGM